MLEVVLYGVGSKIVVDFEESLFRAGIAIAGAVRNLDIESCLLDDSPLVEIQDLSDELRSRPFLVPLFTPSNRQSAVQDARRNGFSKPFTLIDPSVSIPRSLKAEPGLFMNVGVNIGGACEFDEFVFVNRGATIGHHAKLGRFVSIGPAAVLGGQVHIEQGALIGAGAVVLPKVRLGSNSVVGAGSVVTKNVPSNCQVVGSPARIVKHEIAGYGGVGVF